jgi:hypothetical protein
MPVNDGTSENDVQPQSADPGDMNGVDAGFLVSMGDREATWFLDFLCPSEPRRYYVRARDPGLKEDDITQAGVNFRYDQVRKSKLHKGRGEPATQMGSTVVHGDPAPVRQFLAKCRFQVLDFCLPILNKQRERVDLTFNPANRGENLDNDNFYLHLYPVKELREEIEGFLDWIAGREGPAAEDFAELKNAQPGRLRSS